MLGPLEKASLNHWRGHFPFIWRRKQIQFPKRCFKKKHWAMDRVRKRDSFKRKICLSNKTSNLKKEEKLSWQIRKMGE
jgi:hypothetical protein